MSYSLISVFIVLANLSFSDMKSDFDLPKIWTKDFIITLSFTGSMDGSSTRITFTYDTCKYVRNSGMEAKKESVFVLTETDRIEILKRLQILKVNKIHSEPSLEAVHDGWSTLMCFGNHCIQGGTSAKMSDYDKDQFSNAFGYLESFAMKKSKE